MKTFKYFLLIFLFVVACNNGNETPEEPETSKIPEPEEQECISAHSTTNHFELLYPERLEYMNMPRPDDSYNYPAYPGMEEWAKYKTTQEMKAVCQIPTCILEKMSTQAVIQAIMEYPIHFYLGFALNFQLQAGIEAFKSSTNTFNELVNRENTATVLLERLVLVNPLQPLSYIISYDSQLLELLISQTVFLAQMDDDTKKKIIEISLRNDDLRYEFFASKNEDNEWSRVMYRLPAWLLIGRTLLATGYAPFAEVVNSNENLKYFLDGWWPEGYLVEYAGYPLDRRTAYIYMDGIYGDLPQLIIDYCINFLNEFPL